MEKSTSEITLEYIREHPYIKSCLRKGIINYSSLARLVAKELDIEKKSSKDAILIAARRYHEKLKKEVSHEKKIKDLLAASELEMKNKIAVFILEKGLNLDQLHKIELNAVKASGTFYLIEGSENYTLIIQGKHSKMIKEKFKRQIVRSYADMALIHLKSPKDIENIQGVMSYLTTLFVENGVNIIEFLSCWTDTLFVIESKDVGKTIDFMKF